MSDQYIFWDLETTGRNDKFNQITQVGAVLTNQNFEVKDKLEIHSNSVKENGLSQVHLLQQELTL